MADYTTDDTSASRMGLILGAVAIVAIVLLVFFLGGGDGTEGGTVVPADTAAPLAAPETDATIAPAAPEADPAPTVTE